MPSFLTRTQLVPLIIACALFMEHLDSSILTTALPTIALALQADPLHLNLAITAYMFSLAVFIPLSGWLADRYGSRTIFRLAILIFTLSSVACGFSQNLTELVIGRLFQGLGGAMMVPVGRLVLVRAIPKSKLVDAMAWLTIPALIGPVMGPPLGGLIVTYGSWRWIFFVNIPIGILGMVLATLYIDNIKEDKQEPLDLKGFFLLATALVGLVFGFETVGRNLLPASIVNSLLVGGALFLAVYILQARQAAAPIIDLDLFKIPTFFAATVGGFLFRIGVGALPFLLPLMLQLGFGMSPLSSGLLTLASAAGAMFMKFSAGKIIHRYGFRSVLIGNTIISAFFLALYGLFQPTTPGLFIFIALLAGGYFRSLQFTGLNTLTFADIPPALMSRATTLSSMLQQLSFSVGVGVGAILLNATLWRHRTSQLSANDFWPALVVIGLLTLGSVPFFMQLALNAGAGLRKKHEAIKPPLEEHTA